jgi:ribosomal protein L2
VRRRLRLVDFYRWEAGEQDVLSIEYDPGRSAHIALVQHRETARKSYILASDGLRKGDVVRSYRTLQQQKQETSSSLDLGIFRTQAIRPGNVLPLHLIPIGTQIHAISLLPNGPAKLVRSAGAAGQLIALSHRKETPTSAAAASGEAEASATSEDVETIDTSSATTAAPGQGPPTHAQVKLQSGEVRLVPASCCATIGRVSNIDHEHVRLGKAGRSRWLGRRPKVRGVAMNATDHPHGGGRGKSKSNMHPKSIYGWLAKGKRTRKPGTRGGNVMVVRERPRRNGKRLGKP